MQPEALAHEQIHVLEVNLATKSDIGAVKVDLEGSIEKFGSDLARWMLAGWVTQTGVLAALLWYFYSGMPGG